MTVKDFYKKDPLTGKFVFATCVKRAREEKEISLTKFAKSIGCSAAYWSEVERGNKLTPVNLLPKIAKALGIEENELDNFMDTSYLTREELAPDMAEYIKNNPKVLKALRLIKDNDLDIDSVMNAMQSVVNNKKQNDNIM